MSKARLLSLGFCMLCFHCTVARSHDAQNADKDARLRALQGTWELVLEVNGRTVRTVRTIVGNIETVQRFDGATGRKLAEHQAEIMPSSGGDVNVLTFRMNEQPNSPPLSYVYKLDGNQLYEITGVLSEPKYKNNVATPRIFRWERVSK